VGSAIGYAMDGFDLLILGFMLNAISSDLHLTSVQAASLVTATLVGAVVGGFGFGMLSDRLGRVRVLTWTIVVFAVFTGMCA
jgi:MFS family permease